MKQARELNILETVLIDSRSDGYKIWQHIDNNDYYITGDGCNPFMAYDTIQQAINCINYIKKYLGKC